MKYNPFFLFSAILIENKYSFHDIFWTSHIYYKLLILKIILIIPNCKLSFSIKSQYCHKQSDSRSPLIISLCHNSSTASLPSPLGSAVRLLISVPERTSLRYVFDCYSSYPLPAICSILFHPYLTFLPVPLPSILLALLRKQEHNYPLST